MNTHPLNNLELHVKYGNYAYPYTWESMQCPVFYCIIRALHETSEWILRGFDTSIKAQLLDRSSGSTALKVCVNESTIAEGLFSSSDLLDSYQPAYFQLTRIERGMDAKNCTRLLHAISIAATIVSMEQHLGYDTSPNSKQTFSYNFDPHQIPLADAFFQKMSGASSRLKSITSEVTQSDPGTNPNHYCTFTWSGPLVQVEELARQSVDFGSELGFVNSAEDLFRHFSITPYLPNF